MAARKARLPAVESLTDSTISGGWMEGPSTRTLSSRLFRVAEDHRQLIIVGVWETGSLLLVLRIHHCDHSGQTKKPSIYKQCVVHHMLSHRQHLRISHS